MNATAQFLLANYRQRGIHLTANGDRLCVKAPAGAIDLETRAELTRFKPELLALVQVADEPDAENIAEFIQERAAVMEFDGGLPRAQAEQAAMVRAVVHFKLIGDQGGGVLIDDEGFDSAVQVLRNKFGDRLESLFRIGGNS